MVVQTPVKSVLKYLYLLKRTRQQNVLFNMIINTNLRDRVVIDNRFPYIFVFQFAYTCIIVIIVKSRIPYPYNYITKRLNKK